MFAIKGEACYSRYRVHRVDMETVNILAGGMGTKVAQVTQEDIDTGQRVNAFCCPVAKAISRVMGGRYLVSVSTHSIGVLNLDTFKWEYFTPDAEVTRFIRAFDMREKVEPFEFEIDPPEVQR
jgi:hypothetical protein